MKAKGKQKDAIPSEPFATINEKKVENISLEIFYNSHTITLLVGLIAYLLYTTFTREDTIYENNVWAGFCAVFMLFLIISLLAFPNGPFIRPHPACWKIVFGISAFYEIILLFLLFQNVSTMKYLKNYVFPEIGNYSYDTEKRYAVDCPNVTIMRMWDMMDEFALSHFLGWVMKTLLIRHYGICWCISIMWELTEYFFIHLLPNFEECWWDSAILDVLICNGAGIYVGMKIIQFFELRTYKWESIKNINSTSGKIRRAVMQFTPERFS